mmetsp:Transcript_24061/g.56137  ORF Transcript_24061/g.56137 Transcript_24061/m.56137 type:complete len:105 (-) Transcript_24061:372-686(-)
MIPSTQPSVSFDSSVEVIEIPSHDEMTRSQLFYSARELVGFRREAKREKLLELAYKELKEKYGEERMQTIKRRYEAYQHQKQEQRCHKRRRMENATPVVQAVAE